MPRDRSASPSEGGATNKLRRKEAWERVLELEERALELERLARVFKGAADFAADRIPSSSPGWSDRASRALHEAEAARLEARKARRSYHLRLGLPSVIAGLVILAALAAMNALWFAAVGRDYLGWYLENGTVIALLFGFVAVAVDLDDQPDLISAHPLGFVVGVVMVSLELDRSLRTLLDRPRSDRALAQAGASLVQSRYRWRMLDRVLAHLFLLIFAAGMLAWAFVVAPLQYWVNLVCGAPARMSLASWRTVWRIKDGPHHTRYVTAPKDRRDFVTPQDARELEEARERGRAAEITFATKPVTLTAAIAAAVLWAVSRFV